MLVMNSLGDPPRTREALVRDVRFPLTAAPDLASLATSLARGLGGALVAEGAQNVRVIGTSVIFNGASLRGVPRWHPLRVVDEARLEVVPSADGLVVKPRIRLRWGRLLLVLGFGALAIVVGAAHPLGAASARAILYGVFGAALLARGLWLPLRLRSWLRTLAFREVAHLEYKLANPSAGPEDDVGRLTRA